MKKRFSYVMYGFFVLFFLSSCATYRIRLGSATEWIEGKPFPVEITFTETEKISDVVLRYSFNGMNTKAVRMNQVGNNFAYTIPGEEVVSGILRYDIAYTFNNKAKSTGSITVKILSLAEAKQKFMQELHSRISFSPPAQVPVNRDTQLIVKVKSYKPSTRVNFFYKMPIQPSFQEVELKNINGTFTAVISERELQAGYNTYYFSVTEDNVDVGELKVFVNGRDSANPFQFTILSLAELKEAIIGELYSSVSHNIPQDVYATRDLEILLSVKYGSNTFIHELSKNAVSVEIMYKSPTSGFKRAVMTGFNNQFTYTISSAELKSGYNAYFFKVTDDIEDIGPVTVEYPASRDLFSYKILTVEEIRELKAKSMYQRIAHTPVTEAEGVSDLSINLRIEDANISTTAVLFLKRPTMKRYKSINMTRKRDIYTGIISKDDQQSGYTQYYFLVTEEDSDVGTVSVEFPENGQKNPIQYTVLDKNLVLKKAILDGIDFTPIADAEYGVPVEVKITLNNNPAGTKVYLRYRLADDTLTYLSLEMKQDGKKYTAILSPALLKQSKRVDYYISINVDQYTFTYPDESIIPLYFYIKQKLAEDRGYETIFGTTIRSEKNMLEGRIYQLKPGTRTLPQNMQKDHESLMVLYTIKLDIQPRDFTKGLPGLEDVFKWFGVQYRGVVAIKESGQYRFRLLSDDGSKLYIDDVLVADNDGVHDAKSETGDVYLSAGVHSIRVDYFQGPKKEIALQLFVTMPGKAEKLFDLGDFE